MDQKTLYNTLFMTGFLLFLIALQSSVLPYFFNTRFNTCFWIPYITYWYLFRKHGECIVMLYLLSYIVAATSSTPFSHLLFIHALILLILLPFKRVYFVNWKFYSISVAIILFCFPLISNLLFSWEQKRVILPHLGALVLGGALTWLFSFPLFGIMKWFDLLFGIHEKQKTWVSSSKYSSI